MGGTVLPAFSYFGDAASLTIGAVLVRGGVAGG
jgi:hypothetical protein